MNRGRGEGWVSGRNGVMGREKEEGMMDGGEMKFVDERMNAALGLISLCSSACVAAVERVPTRQQDRSEAGWSDESNKDLLDDGHIHRSHLASNDNLHGFQLASKENQGFQLTSKDISEFQLASKRNY